MDLIDSVANVFLFLLGAIGLWRIYRIAKRIEKKVGLLHSTVLDQNERKKQVDALMEQELNHLRISREEAVKKRAACELELVKEAERNNDDGKRNP